MLVEGVIFTQEKIVLESETASKIASGALEVFSTPMLVAFMENTAFKLAESHLNPGESTVGTSLNIKHLKANLVGDKLQCTATLTKVDGKKLTFNIDVFFNETLVGTGEHGRYIIEVEKFMSKLRG